MFTFVIVTNRTSADTNKSIDVLLKTKKPQDTVMVINYNNYSLNYRGIEGIVYKHIKQSRKQAVNISLPKNEDVVILDDEIIISDGFVDELYKYYNPNCLCSLRIDKSTNNRRFIESDFRIGSTITPKSFIHFAIAFNTGLLQGIGETAEETAIIASGLGMPLLLLQNVRVVMPSTKNKTQDTIGITILIPSLKYKFSDDIKRDLRDNDRIYEFDSDPRGVARFINQTIPESSNNCILIINPQSKIQPIGMLNRIRGLYSDSVCILFNTTDTISADTWLVVPKTKYVFTHKVFDTIEHLHNNIVSYNNRDLISYIIGDEKKKNMSNIQLPNMISIIIPYMHLGDRWPLFEVCMEKLYSCTKNHPNIEIVVHECGPKRHISPEFIGLYDIEYMFSEYHGLFHRAWCLNVVSRFMAKGDTLVFFDGDLLVDDVWVNELLSCDKAKAYIGWGKMINLTKESTDRYIKTKEISGRPERVREPDRFGPAGGINIIPRSMFFDIGGWPESYKDMGYGGEDNSLAFKMDILKIYGDKVSRCKFTSSVYHLFHGHETKRDKARHPLFHKHLGYKKEDWLEHIKRNYNWGRPVDGTVNLSKFKPYINESLLYCYKNSEKTRITVCMVNFLRYEKLINTLTLLSNFGVPINVLLWVNQSDSMLDNDRKVVEGLMSKFSKHEITYCKKNLGVGYPRYMMNNRAIFEYGADYIVTMDDDTPHSSADSLVLAATILDQKEYSEYGAIGLWCSPNFPIVRVVGDSIKTIPSTEGFHMVDCLGSGTMTVRREVVEKCNYDPQYVMGLEDWDFSLTMKNEGWKLGLVCDPRYKPMNDMRGNSKEYTASRWNQSVIDNSKVIFKKKWNLANV